jgi:N-methylhydantoinase A
VPPNAGVGSAVGFLRAPVAFEVVRSRYMRLADFDLAAANRLLQEMRAEALAVVEPGAAGAPLIERRFAFMRYVGQGHEIVVLVPDRDLDSNDIAGLRADFEREYTALFSRIIPNAEVEILTWTLSLGTEGAEAGIDAPLAKGDGATSGSRGIYDPELGHTLDVPSYRRSDLVRDAILAGPAVITEDETTTFVSASFNASLNGGGCIVLDRKS